ncbi:hypothetical protein Tco_0352560 [Tanacetum coccineum]
MSQTPRQIKRGRDTKIPQSSGPFEKVGDEAVHKELGDRMERAATTASSLEAEQDSVNTLRSGEGSMKLMEFMEHCTKLSELVVSEASTRRHLKLKDSNGISSLPTSEIFKQLALIGRGCYHAHVHLSQDFSQLGKADGGSMTLSELTVLCTTLSKKVETLESDLKQTKLTYGAAYTKLIMKVKKLEHKVKSSKSNSREAIEHDFEEPNFEFITPEEYYTTEPDISTALIVQLVMLGKKLVLQALKFKLFAESLVISERSASQKSNYIGKIFLKESLNLFRKGDEVATRGLNKYWKIIRVGSHTEVYQIFEDMLKNFDKDDLVKLWSVHERFNSTEPTEDKERELLVELKRLFEPDDDDIL